MGVGVHLILLETAKLFPRAAEVFCAPTSNVWEFQLLHIFANTSVILFKILSQPTGMQNTVHCSRRYPTFLRKDFSFLLWMSSAVISPSQYSIPNLSYFRTAWKRLEIQ